MRRANSPSFFEPHGGRLDRGKEPVFIQCKLYSFFFKIFKILLVWKSQIGLLFGNRNRAQSDWQTKLIFFYFFSKFGLEMFSWFFLLLSILMPFSCVFQVCPSSPDNDPNHASLPQHRHNITTTPYPYHHQSTNRNHSKRDMIMLYVMLCPSLPPPPFSTKFKETGQMYLSIGCFRFHSI